MRRGQALQTRNATAEATAPPKRQGVATNKVSDDVPPPPKIVRSAATKPGDWSASSPEPQPAE